MSFSSENVALRATYALEAKLIGMDAAIHADRTLRDSTKQTRTTIEQAAIAADRMSAKQAEGWKRAAAIAKDAQSRIADGQIQAQRKIDSSITQTVSKMRKMGLGYDEIRGYMERYRTDAIQTAAAIERAAGKEIDALDRVAAAHKRVADLRTRVATSFGGGTRDPIHPVGAVARAPGRIGGAIRGAASGVGGMLVGGLLGYVGVQGIRDAATNTTELAKQAMILNRYAGLSQQSALEFAAVTQAYGVSSQKSAQTFRMLGTAVNNALTKPTESNTRVFRQLGITQQEVAAHSHDLVGMLGLVADHLNKMPPGAAKTADAAKLLGRSWQVLLPLLAGGSKGMNDQLQAAKAMGVEMGGNTSQNAMKLHEAMIELKVAQIGVEVQFTEHILPALLKVTEFGLKLYGVIRTNLSPVFHALGQAVHGVSGFLKEHQTLLHGVEIAVSGLAAAYLGLKVISTVTRLVRGATADFRNMYDIVKTGGKALFAQQTQEEKLLAANAELAASNIRLAESFDAVAASAGMATKAEGVGAVEGALSGGPMGSMGRAAGTAERTVAAEGGALRAGETAAADASGGGILGSLLGRAQSSRIATSVKTLAGRAGLGGVFLGDAGAAAAGAGAARAAATGASEVGAVAGTAEKGVGILGRIGGLAGGLMGGLGIAGMGMMGSQLAGSLIGGVAGHGVGSAVSSIGTGASIGAGVGSVIPIPVLGTGVGAALGAGIGALIHFDPLGLWGPSKQQADASKLMADVQSKINGANADTLQNLQRRYTAQLHEGGLTRKQADAVQGALTTRGLQVAAPALQTTMQDITTSQYKPGASTIAVSTEQDLARLPGQAQRIGAEAMIQFTAGMEQKGQLPRGTTNRLISDLEQAYGPKLAQRLNADSASSMQVIADNIKNSKILANTQSVIDGIHQKWALLIPDQQVNSDNYVNVVGGDLARLEQISKTAHGHMRDDALHAIQQLKDQSAAHFQAMAQDTAAKISAMSSSIKSGSQDAASTASGYFATFAGNIHAAMKDGALKTSQGVSAINTVVSQELKALGAAPPKIKLQGIADIGGQAFMATGQAPAGFSKIGAAPAGLPAGETGMRVPGPIGPDNWTLVDPSGRPAAMVGGAEILVANRHTEARVDRMLSAFGTSLGQEVANEATPHSLATGGRIPGYLLGGRAGGASAQAASGLSGYSLPIPRQYMSGTWSPDQGIDIALPAHTPEYAVGPGVIVQEGIQGFGPWAPILKVTQGPLAGNEFYYGHAGPNYVPVGAHVQAGQAITQVGAGRVGISTGPHIEFGFWPPRGGSAVAALLHSLMSGAGVTGFGGGGPGLAGGASVPTIKAPHVQGGGMLGDMVQHGLDKVANAANAKAQALAGTAGGVTGSVAAIGNQKQIVTAAAQKYGVPRWVLGGVFGMETDFGHNIATSSAGAMGGFQFIPSTASIFGYPMTNTPNAAQFAQQASIAANYLSQLFHQTGNWNSALLAYSGGGYGAGQVSGKASVGGYARGGRIARAATGTTLTTSGGWTYSGGSSGRGRSHKPAAVTMHLNPFTGTYQMMTAAQATALRDSYIAKYGHPYRAPHHRAARRPPPKHMHFDPFTMRYEMMTAAAASAMRDAYIRKYGHTPPSAPPRSKVLKTPSSLRQEAAAVASGNAVGLTSGFDLGYMAAITPGTGTGVTTLSDALLAAISGVEQTPTGGKIPLYGASRGVRVRAGHGSPVHVPAAHVPSTTHSRSIGTVHHAAGTHVGGPGHIGVKGGTKVTATDTFAYDWATSPMDTYTAILDPAEIYGGADGFRAGGEIPVLASGADYGPGNNLGHAAGRAIRTDVTRVAAGGAKGQLSNAMTNLSAQLNNVEKVSYSRLDALATRLQAGIKKAGATSPEGKRLTQALQLVDYQEGKRVGTLVANAENQANALQGASTRLQRVMARGNISSSSGQAAAMMQQFDQQSVKVLHSTVSALQNALKKAKKAGDKSAVSDITDKLNSALDSLDQATTDAVQASYDVVTNSAADVVNNAQQGQTRLSSQQTIAGQQGTQGADQAMAGYLQTSVIPVLNGSLTDLNNKLQAAVASGDSGMQKTIRDAIDSTTSALAQATGDLRTSIEDAAAAAVQSATHASTMADLGEQALTIQQGLSGTTGTPIAAQQMTDYINTNIIPSLQNELGKLQDQQAAAQSVGDQTLADQIAEAIAQKSNDIQQQKLDALNAIKDSTAGLSQDLQNLSGATGFDYSSQPFTDDISALVGA